MGSEERRNAAEREAALNGLRMNEERMGPVLRWGAHQSNGCPKCGAPGAQALRPQWHAGFDPRNPEDPCRLVGEHLHYVCAGCGFHYRTQTQDADLLEPGRASEVGAVASILADVSVLPKPGGAIAVGKTTEA